jgi:serine/threonine protein phosphatase 1
MVFHKVLGRARTAMQASIPSAGERRTVPPGQRVYAIGDIHGRMDLLQSLLERIQADHAARAAVSEPPTLVFMGDYVDRGLRSRDVITHLTRTDFTPFRVRFLKGNHEAAMLRFLEKPETGQSWLSFGGAETLFSYGVQPPIAPGSRASWAEAGQSLQANLPDEHVTFLRQLELYFTVGGYAFVHAGFRPGKPLADQDTADLLSIREPFLSAGDVFGYTVVHGHTPVDAAECKPGRIAIDTGAYVTGRLSAVRLEGEEVSFLTT